MPIAPRWPTKSIWHKRLEAQKKVVNDIEEKSVQYNILKRDVDTNKDTV